MSYTDNLRVEVAFTTTPDDPVPAFRDISAYCDLAGGISITRYRQDEYATVQPGSCRITLDNSDGRFTAGLTSSPYYPNVKLRKKVRVSYRDPAVDGNVLTAEDASFEGGTVGTWTPGGTVHPTLTSSTTHPHGGTKGLLITWGTGGTLPLAQCNSPLLSAHVIGRVYTAAAWVYVPAGSPNVLLSCAGVQGTASAVTGALTRISVTYTATAPNHGLQVWPASAPTSGQQAWVDDVQVDEGSSVRTFTTTAPPVYYRFTGYVEEWPTEWPNGSTGLSAAVLSAVDRLKRLGTIDSFRSVIEQEYLSDSPYAYYTLGEPATATQAGDTSKNGRNPLAIAQFGTGGTLAFGSATGPGTDAMTALALTAASAGNGKYLTGTLPQSNPLTSGHTLESFFLTTGTDQRIAAIVPPTAFLDRVLALSVTAAGKLFGYSVWGTVTSAASVNDGLTHHAAVKESISGTTVTVTLYLDGVSAGTATGTASFGVLSPFTGMMVGSNRGSVFTGTLAHAACYDTALSGTRIADHAAAGSTGFSGERSDQRIARYARWAAISTADQTLDTGLSTSVAFVDPSGQSPLAAMRAIEETESGILAINGAGQLLFQSRAHRYNATSVLTLAGSDVGRSARFVANDAQLVNDVTASRPNGITYRAVNTDSITDFGNARITATLLTTSDNEVIDAANWKANQTAIPLSRLPNLTLDLTTDPSLLTSVLALDISSRITVSSLPTQAPASSVDLFVEGWTESITTTAWTVTLNTSPAPSSGVWQLDSAVYSQLDVSTRLAY